MPSRFERKLREHLHREAGAVRVLPHALTLRMRQGSESRRGFAIVPQLAMACGLLLFAGLLAYGAGASRAGGRAPAGRLPAPANLAFHASFAAMATLGIIVRERRVHLLIALAMVVFSVTYVSMLFAHLGQS